MGKYDREGELSTSQIQAFQRCKRKWWFQYSRQLQYSDAGNKPVTVGNIVHKVMEYYYRPGEKSDPIDQVDIMVKEMVELEPTYEEAITNHAMLAKTMVLNYFDWVEETNADVGIVIESVENRISVPLGDTGFTLTGRPDARATRFGMRLPIDHKTVDSFDQIPKTAQINHQFLTYCLLEYLNDREATIDAVMINMFRRVDHNHELSKPPYFDRYEVRYNLNELRAHWYHILSVAREISQAVERLDNGENHQKVVPPTPSKNCSWDCSFRVVCPMFDDGSNAEGFLESQFDEPGKERHGLGIVFVP